VGLILPTVLCCGTHSAYCFVLWDSLCLLFCAVGLTLPTVLCCGAHSAYSSVPTVKWLWCTNDD